ncbi:UDP-N-acetylmuramate dehydrogenase [Maribacter hydrothermalis]|uniref:UDP-N-acetylenolpyruvoylglucosamine reductase n=1 Tax=Maribacter hydrothermalis TaxID=1836467 RepID=A0A1B7ZBE9_9FLAO|nr:UDP-N-acetylmuramate dehydrogenase [Maribacter hydrothermalis]APQ16480.1 UDP-N-acetylenolpyruvoylglucosamine reductase [Maribacter hydrothermalis]OBR40044.1 UDP-N-acetylenolpyruvoylglucosamine reductase [Maribacter hydrothermalis]
MTILEHFSLKNYNTFGIDSIARYFVEIVSIEELRDILSNKEYTRKILLGGGSNMLLTDSIDALFIHVNIKGKHIISESNDTVQIQIMAGENWHDMVMWTIENGFGGLENMSLIPGNTGTAPIQNIGAYGVELKDCFVSCNAIRIEDQKLITLTKEDCEFGYRDSYFKNEGKDKYVITSVTFSLIKENHTINAKYGSIEEQLKNDCVTNPTIKDISNAVIAIRQSKLPDPKVLGNSGSFFKNPIVSKEIFDTFIAKNPQAPYYKISELEYKIPAGWLIEQCGFKGKRFGDAGVHKNQALVLVNYNNATGKDILDLAKKIIEEVKHQFQITISPEVNLIK